MSRQRSARLASFAASPRLARRRHNATGVPGVSPGGSGTILTTAAKLVSVPTYAPDRGSPMPPTTPPPFRADHIGSLLRPPKLLAERARFEAGRISADNLREIEDAAIREALAMQERVGLKLATDGEFRRRSYHSLFLRPARRRPHRHGRRPDDAEGRQCGPSRATAGRGDRQPAEVDAADQCGRPRVHRGQHQADVEDHDPRPVRAALPRRQRGGAGDAPTRTWTSSGPIPSTRSWPSSRRWQGRLPLRADRRDGVRQVRRPASAGHACSSAATNGAG